MKKVVLMILTIFLSINLSVSCSEKNLIEPFYMQTISTPLGSKEFNFIRPMSSLMGGAVSAVDLYTSAQNSQGAVIIAAAKARKEIPEIILVPLAFLLPHNLENIFDSSSTYYYQVVGDERSLQLIDVTLPVIHFLKMNSFYLSNGIGHDLLIGHKQALESYNLCLNLYRQHYGTIEGQYKEEELPENIAFQGVPNDVEEEAKKFKEDRAVLKKIRINLVDQIISEYIDGEAKEILEEVCEEERAAKKEFFLEQNLEARKNQSLEVDSSLEIDSPFAVGNQSNKKKKRKYKKSLGASSQNYDEDDLDSLLEEAKKSGQGAFNQNAKPEIVRPRVSLRFLKSLLSRSLQEDKSENQFNCLYLTDEQMQDILKAYEIIQLASGIDSRLREIEEDVKLSEINEKEKVSFCDDITFKRAFFNVYKEYSLYVIKFNYYIESKKILHLMPQNLNVLINKTTDCFTNLSDKMLLKKKDKAFDLNLEIINFFMNIESIRKELYSFPLFDKESLGLEDTVETFNSIRKMMSLILNLSFDLRSLIL